MAIGETARALGRRIKSVRHIGKITALVALLALLGAGYAFGGPPASANNLDASRFQGSALSAGEKVMPAQIPAAAATAAPAGVAYGSEGQSTTDGSTDTLPYAPAPTGNVIIRTGQMSLEVTDVDKAASDAQAAVAAVGGYVSSSNRSGSGDYATTTITFRIPAGKWDDMLAALRKIGSKVVSEETDATDVTMQVVDVEARLDNLQKTEAALQAIMARAASVSDVLDVQTQLSQTEGQIEELTAERDHLNDQAAMSTLTLTLSLPGPTVTTTATQNWTLGDQVDQAAAALVRIGQGIVTIGVWAVIVALPVAVGLLVLFLLYLIVRRIVRRGSRTEAPAA